MRCTGAAALLAHGALGCRHRALPGRSPKDKHIISDGQTGLRGLQGQQPRWCRLSSLETLHADFRAYPLTATCSCRSGRRRLIRACDLACGPSTNSPGTRSSKRLIRPDAEELASFVPDDDHRPAVLQGRSTRHVRSASDWLSPSHFPVWSCWIGGIAFMPVDKEALIHRTQLSASREGRHAERTARPNAGPAGDAAIFFGLSGTGNRRHGPIRRANSSETTSMAEQRTASSTSVRLLCQDDPPVEVGSRRFSTDAPPASRVRECRAG